MKKFWGMVMAAATVGLLYSAANSPAQASWNKGTRTLWTLVTPDGDANQATLCSTNVKNGKNAYMWNYSHTKRIHNLKNYRNTTWYAIRGISKNGHVYYRVTNYTKKIKGLVWSGYVRKYVQKTAWDFKTAASYQNYIQTEPSQKLTRAILKQFPNVPVDFQLSRYASRRFDVFPKSINGFTDITPISTLILPKSDFMAIDTYDSMYSNEYTGWTKELRWYWGLTYGQPVQQRAEKIAEAMQQNDIDPSQFTQANGHWVIGISLYDGMTEATVILARKSAESGG